MAIITNNPTAYDEQSWLIAVWSALNHWRSLALEEGDPTDEKDWDEVCSSMAWITEELGYKIDEDGDYVRNLDHERREPSISDELRRYEDDWCQACEDGTCPELAEEAA